jgi:hypothetical protein
MPVALSESTKTTVIAELKAFIRMVIEAHPKGDSTETIAYLKFLQTQFPGQRLLILWDGASYHHS